METTELVTFEINTSYFNLFEKEFAKLVRKANKLGVEAPTFEVLGEKVVPARIETVVVASDEDWSPLSFFSGTQYQTVSTAAKVLKIVKVSGPAPKLAGWLFVAVLQHEDGGNLVHRVPGTDAVSVSLDMRTAKPYCGHCRTTRRRNDTFVVAHDDGRQLQVGRNCLADFTGINSPEKVARWAELLGSFVESFSEDAEERLGGGGGRRESQYPLDVFLGLTCAAIRENGWKSRTSAREYGGRATADFVVGFLCARTKQEARLQIAEVTEGDVKRGKTAREFAKTHFDAADETGTVLSDYEHNLRLIAQGGAVGLRASGLAASLVVFAEKLMGREIERRTRAASEFQGAVGDKKHVATLIVSRVIDIEGQYGVSHLHLLQDRNGNRYTWKASSECLDVGSIYQLIGTVKEHKAWTPRPNPEDGHYNNCATNKGGNRCTCGEIAKVSVKQTVLTRCAADLLVSYKSTTGTGGAEDWAIADETRVKVEAKKAAKVAAAKAQSKIDAKARKALVKEGHKPTCTQVTYVGRGYQCSCGHHLVQAGHKPECLGVTYNNDQSCDCGIKAAADAKKREELLAAGHQPTCMTVTRLWYNWNCDCGLKTAEVTT